MIYGMWNFGSMPFGTSPAANLIGISAAMKYTGIFDEAPLSQTVGLTPDYSKINGPYPQVTPAYNSPPPPFGCGKSAMIQLWELALKEQQNKQ